MNFYNSELLIFPRNEQVSSDVLPRKIFQPHRFYDLISSDVQKHALISISLNFLSFPFAQTRIFLIILPSDKNGCR